MCAKFCGKCVFSILREVSFVPIFPAFIVAEFCGKSASGGKCVLGPIFPGGKCVFVPIFPVFIIAEFCGKFVFVPIFPVASGGKFVFVPIFPGSNYVLVPIFPATTWG